MLMREVKQHKENFHYVLNKKEIFPTVFNVFYTVGKHIHNMTFYTEIAYTRYDRYTHLLAFSF